MTALLVRDYSIKYAVRTTLNIIMSIVLNADCIIGQRSYQSPPIYRRLGVDSSAQRLSFLYNFITSQIISKMWISRGTNSPVSTPR